MPRKAPRPDAVAPPDDLLALSGTKKDKRQIRHASFVSRIEKTSGGGGGVGKKPLKRRRPGKKLNTTLDALADALPDLDHDSLARLQEGKVRHRSLKNGKDALRKKEKIVRGEVERFGVSLARLNAVGAAASSGDGTEAQRMQVEEDQGAGAGGSLAESGNAQGPQPPSSTANRWAALRGFISATMEQNPAFVGNTQDRK